LGCKLVALGFTSLSLTILHACPIGAAWNETILFVIKVFTQLVYFRNVTVFNFVLEVSKQKTVAFNIRHVEKLIEKLLQLLLSVVQKIFVCVSEYLFLREAWNSVSLLS
jgi:hypothetical protein